MTDREPWFPALECPHGIARDGCIYCAEEYQGKDVRDGFCPACNDERKPPTTSTWHVVRADGTATCAACKHEHPYRPGHLERAANSQPPCRPNASGRIAHEFASTKDGVRCLCGEVEWKSLFDA